MVEKLWPQSTIAILASGPSLAREDVDALRGRSRVLAINTSYQMAPWADVLYAADWKWWNWHRGAADFAGLKFSVSRKAGQWPGVTVLKHGAEMGLSDDPAALCLGKNSGYQAINLAVLLGAARILLLGYDLQRGPKGQHHWHKDHPTATLDHYELYRKNIDKLSPHLAARHVEVLNCSRQTALTKYPRVSLDQALGQREVAA